MEENNNNQPPVTHQPKSLKELATKQVAKNLDQKKYGDNANVEGLPIPEELKEDVQSMRSVLKYEFLSILEMGNPVVRISYTGPKKSNTFKLSCQDGEKAMSLGDEDETKDRVMIAEKDLPLELTCYSSPLSQNFNSEYEVGKITILPR